MHVPSWMPVIFYAVVILLFIGVYSYVRIEGESEKKPFSNLVFITAAMLVADFVSRMYVYDGFPLWIVVVATYINFAIMAVVGVYWYRFVRLMLAHGEFDRIKRTDYVVFTLSTIALLVLLVNPIFNTVFSFDGTGVYHRGPAYFFPAGATYLSILIAEVFLFRSSKTLGNSIFYAMVLFPVPPLVGGIVATFIYGIPWMPLGIALSMIILFTVLHTAGLGTDFLTGLSNRRRLMEVFEERAALVSRGRPLAAILADLDDFKNINDTYGHDTGDVALVQTAKILRESIGPNDEVGRIGGDEFIILADDVNEEDVQALITRIGENIAAFNKASSTFDLELSLGYAFYDPHEYETIEAYMDQIDQYMYENKRNRKAAKAAKVAKAAQVTPVAAS